MMNTLGSQTRVLHRRSYAVLLLSFFLLAYLLPIGFLDLIPPDETRYGAVPREMIAGGDWVAPHLNGVRYFEKPVLGYWIHAASILLFGENNFAVRLPSALAMGLSALLIGMLVSRIRDRDTDPDGVSAALAVLVFLSSFEVFWVGNIADLDSLFGMFLTGTIAALFCATEATPGSARERWLLLLSGLWCGLAFLTKGFLAFVVPGLALAPYLIWQRRWRDLLRMSWLPILTAVLLVLPWGLWIQLREPDFWRFFIWNEHLRRFMAHDAQHTRSVFFYVLLAPGAFLPWIFMVPAAVSGIRGRLGGSNPQGRLMRLSICWLILPFLFFSAAKGKLPTYILPCFAPAAILVALGLFHGLRNRRTAWFRRGAIAAAVVSGLGLLGILSVQYVGYHGEPPFVRSWKLALALAGPLFFMVLCIWALGSRKGTTRAFLFGLSPLLLFSISHFAVPELTLEAKSPGPLLERHRRDIGDHDIIISDEYSIRAVSWYLKRNDAYILWPPGELDYGLKYQDAAGRLLDIRSAVDMIERNPGRTVLIARIKKMSQWLDQLPEPVSRYETGPSGYMIWEY